MPRVDRESQIRELHVEQLRSLESRDFVETVRAWLSRDERWAILVEPAILPRTIWALDRILKSIDRQVERIGSSDPEWSVRIGRLRALVERRQNEVAPPPVPPAHATSREARRWREFSALLASELAKVAPEVLEQIEAPYGPHSAAEWLRIRDEKKGGKQ